MHHALVFVEMCTVLRLAIQINSTALPGDQNTSITDITTNGIAEHILALHWEGVGLCSAIKVTQIRWNISILHI